ncbi:MAG: thiosulfate oxidation carrier complex protein SoxZ [Candidatus Accumulibacter sp.]|nr:thiosulfate oxidation carrier complex protein SoxZ [Accumulibacter sp.]MBA4093644.1 thiosulfate oxidation carrier complex protein SoxZ [Accumulibacter sp.]
MADPIKIRATQQGDITDIRVLMQHPMESGQRKDTASGNAIPAHFIQNFTISANGKQLIAGQLNTAISRNPLFAFRARGLKAGDRLAVHWTDTRGEQRSDEATVAG